MPQKTSAVVSESDLVMYLATGLKHVRLMALLLCFSLLLMLSYYLFSRAVYNSKSLITVRTLAQPVDASTIFHDSSLQVVLSTMQGPEVTRRVAKRLGLNPSRSQLAKEIKRIRIFRNAEKDLIVDIYAYSYRICRDWTPVMLEEYIAYREERQLQMAENTITNFTEQLTELRGKINQGLDQRYNFQQSNSMDKLLIDLNELREIPSALLIVKQRLSAMDRIRESLKQPGRDVVSRLSLFESLESDSSTRLAHGLPDKQLQMNIGMEVPALGPAPGDTSEAQPTTASPNNFIILPSMSTSPPSNLGKNSRKTAPASNRKSTLKAAPFFPAIPKSSP